MLYFALLIWKCHPGLIKLLLLKPLWEFFCYVRTHFLYCSFFPSGAFKGTLEQLLSALVTIKTKLIGYGRPTIFLLEMSKIDVWHFRSEILTILLPYKFIVQSRNLSCLFPGTDKNLCLNEGSKRFWGFVSPSAICNCVRYTLWIMCWQTSPYHSPTAVDTAVHGWGTCHCNSRPIHIGRRSHPASRRLQDSKERHRCSTLEGHMPLLALDTWYLPASTGGDTEQDAWLLKQHKS